MAGQYLEFTSLTLGFKAEGERGLTFQARQDGASESFIDPTAYENGLSLCPMMANSSPLDLSKYEYLTIIIHRSGGE